MMNDNNSNSAGTPSVKPAEDVIDEDIRELLLVDDESNGYHIERYET